MKMNKTCFLTLDLENDCGGRTGPSFDTINKDNINRLVSFFNKKDVPLTLFVTGQIFERKSNEINLVKKKLTKVEFELHSYSHPLGLSDYSKEIERGVRAYKKFFNKKPLGYRAPQGKISEKDFEYLKKSGFKFDASIFPTIRPGVFNNLKMSKLPFKMKKYDLLEIPMSIFPLIKIPIGLGYLRLFGLFVTKMLFNLFKLPNIVVIGFHLHDVELTEHHEKLKGFWNFFYKRNVKIGYKILEYLINKLKKKGYEFKLMKEIL